MPTTRSIPSDQTYLCIDVACANNAYDELPMLLVAIEHFNPVSALAEACKHDALECFEIILNHSWDVLSKWISGFPSLAVKYGSKRCLKALIENYGVPVTFELVTDALNNQMNDEKAIACLEVFLPAILNDPVTFSGVLPSAAGRKSPRCLQFLREHNVSPNTPVSLMMINAAISSSLESMRYLYESDPDQAWTNIDSFPYPLDIWSACDVSCINFAITNGCPLSVASALKILKNLLRRQIVLKDLLETMELMVQHVDNGVVEVVSAFDALLSAKYQTSRYVEQITDALIKTPHLRRACEVNRIALSNNGLLSALDGCVAHFKVVQDSLVGPCNIPSDIVKHSIMNFL